MTKNKRNIWMLWLFTVFFFAYQFVLRLSPGVLIDEIMIKYHISASAFALITSFYYLGYAGMQIPIGVLLNKLGVRYVISASAFICVLGNMSLIISDYWIFALFGRLLIGIGSAAGALGAIHAVRMNFDKKHMSKMIGFSVAISLLGAIYGKSINRILLDSIGMQESIIYLSIPGVFIALGILFFSKETDKKETPLTERLSTWSSLKIVAGNGKVILLSLAGALMVGPLEAFADIFGESYFIAVYKFSSDDAGYLTASAIYFGMCIGSPLLAAVADRFKAHYIINIVCGVVMSGAFYLILNQIVTGYLQMFALTFTIGIMSAYQVIIISTVAEIVPSNFAAIAIAMVNTGNMLAGTAYNTAIGHLLDYYWTGEMIDGKRVYSEIAYTDALFILPITLMMGAIMFFILKPKNGIC